MPNDLPWDDLAKITRDLAKRRVAELRDVEAAMNRALRREVTRLERARSLVRLWIDAADYDPTSVVSVARMREFLNGPSTSVIDNRHTIAWQDGDQAAVARCGDELFKDFPHITTDEWRRCPRCHQCLRLVLFVEVEAAPCEPNDETE